MCSEAVGVNVFVWVGGGGGACVPGVCGGVRGEGG